MKCVICKHGETHPGTATEVLQRDGSVIVYRNVPAQVCDNCGETYLDEATTARLLAEADALASAGTVVDVRDYRAA